MTVKTLPYPVLTSQVKAVGTRVKFWGHVGQYKNHAVLDPVNGRYVGRVTAFYADGDLDVMDTKGHQWRVKNSVV